MRAAWRYISGITGVEQPAKMIRPLHQMPDVPSGAYAELAWDSRRIRWRLSPNSGTVLPHAS